jgi:hypothetical protein
MYTGDESSISGYLFKKTRDGRWQKRWFETNGAYLTYYKSKKMEKLLAALALPQVGDIKIVPAEDDPEHLDGLFSIELNTRIYILRAKSNEEAQQWVSTLGKLRQEGIQSTGGQQTPFKVAASAVNPSDTSSVRTSDMAHSEWIKSGKTCFGCC